MKYFHLYLFKLKFSSGDLLRKRLLIFINLLVSVDFLFFVVWGWVYVLLQSLTNYVSSLLANLVAT